MTCPMTCGHNLHVPFVLFPSDRNTQSWLESIFWDASWREHNSLFLSLWPVASGKNGDREDRGWGSLQKQTVWDPYWPRIRSLMFPDGEGSSFSICAALPEGLLMAGAWWPWVEVGCIWIVLLVCSKFITLKKDTVGEGESRMIWENNIETYTLSYVK